MGTPAVLMAASHHHGARLILLLLIIVIVVVAVVLYRRRPAAHLDESAASAPSTPSEPASVAPARRTVVRSAAGGTPVIRAAGLRKTYGDKVAVDDLTFEVVAGRVTGFLGPNGSGKSTTMRMVMGLDRPDRGSVTVGGVPYHDLRWPLHTVGALLEANALHPGRSAQNHLWMLARSHRIPRRRVDEVLQIVGLTAVARQLVGGFSMGMRQRLGIAAALLGDPEVVLLDEPVNGLDTDGIRWVRGLVGRLAAEGRTVFVSSHLMSEMSLMADHVVVIGKGRLIADLPTDEFTSRYSHRSVRVRSPQSDRLVPALTTAGASVVTESDGSLTVEGLGADQIGEVAWKQSILLHELAPRSATLEEAFIESTESEVEYRGDRSVVAAPGGVEAS